MEFLADNSLGTVVLVVLFSALVMAYAFELVNGFHDTANAVVTQLNLPKLWSGVPRNSDMWVWVATNGSPTALRLKVTVVRPGRSKRSPLAWKPSDCHTPMPAAIMRSGETMASILSRS